jgi:hypothetical protein
MSENTLNLGFSALSASGEGLITREDILRAQDRLKVLKTRAAKSSLRLLWLLAGPGVLVMIGENDGPSMVSYATTGATYGIGFFAPFILLTFLMASVRRRIAATPNSSSSALAPSGAISPWATSCSAIC